MTKKVALFGTAVMTTLLALIVLWQFRIVLVYVFISLALAAALHPLIKRLSGRRWVERAGWIALYLAVLVSFGALLFLTSSAAFNEVQHLAQTVSAQNQWRLPAWLEGTTFQQTVIAALPPPAKLFEAVTGDQGQLVLPAVLSVTQGILDTVSGTLIILFLSLYWVINKIHFERLWLSLLPSEQRKSTRTIWRTIEIDLGAYIRSQVLHSLLAGLLLGLGYWAIGSPYPALLALSGALACLIPVIGMGLAIIPVLLVGLLTGVELSVFTVLFTLAVLIALGVWVKPRLFSQKWDNPILTLVLLIALASVFGLVGILVAPPLSAVCQILWSLLISHRLASGAAAHISDLKERQERVWANIRAMEGTPLPLVISSMERLNQLMVKAEPFLEAAPPPESSEPLLTIGPQPEQEAFNGRAQNS